MLNNTIKRLYKKIFMIYKKVPNYIVRKVILTAESKEIELRWEEYAKGVSRSEMFFDDRGNLLYLMNCYLPLNDNDRPLLEAGLQVCAKTIIETDGSFSNRIVFKTDRKEEEIACIHPVIVDIEISESGDINIKKPRYKSLEDMDIEERKKYLSSIYEYYFVVKSFVETILELGILNILYKHFTSDINKTEEATRFEVISSTTIHQILDILSVVVPEVAAKFKIAVIKQFIIYLRKSEDIRVAFIRYLDTTLIPGYKKYFTREDILEIYNDVKDVGYDISSLISEYKYIMVNARYLNNVFKYNKLSTEQVLESIRNILREFYDIMDIYTYRCMTKEEIDAAIDARLFLNYIYKYQKLTKEQIDIALEIEEDLDILYEYQTLTKEQVDKALDIGKNLDILFKYQRLTKDQIDKALDIVEFLHNLSESDINYLYGYKNLNLLFINLYEYQKLTKEQVDRALEIGKSLYYLYIHQKLTKDQIDRALEIGKDLSMLYGYQKLTREQVDKALEIGKDLDYLYMYQKLTEEQVYKALEIGKNLNYLYMCQSMTKDQIDIALEIGENLDYLYEYQTLTKDQIDKAIIIGEKLFELYKYQKENMTKEQIEKLKEILNIYII